MAASLVTLAACTAPPRDRRAVETLWYTTNDERAIQSLRMHADRVTIVAPQAFSLDSIGAIAGAVAPEIIAIARAHRIKIIPLISNAGFDQSAVHRVLENPTISAAAIHNIAELCRRSGFDGIEFDLEHVAAADRARLTDFVVAGAAALHRVGCRAAVAVVPRVSDSPGSSVYDAWMYENWRGAYDYRALANGVEFISLMTYAQHSRTTPPGPVAGYPWMERAVRYALDCGVPASKLSLGIPAYSEWWYPTYDPSGGARVTTQAVSYEDASEIVATHQISTQWNATERASFAEWQEDGVNQVISIVDARAVGERLKLLRRYQLRGISVWRLGFEDPAVWGLLARNAR